MTAKQELLEIIEGLPEEAAERLLPTARNEAKWARPPQERRSDLLALMDQWRKGDEAMDPAERKRIHEALDNIEPVRVRLPEEL